MRLVMRMRLDFVLGRGGGKAMISEAADRAIGGAVAPEFMPRPPQRHRFQPLLVCQLY